MLLPITLTIAGACALLSVWLGLRVSHLRRLNKVMIGDEGNERVAMRMRAHANFVEYAPIFLILLAAIELAVGPSLWLWAAAILFIVARLAHPFGMERRAPNVMRMAGAGLTWLALLGLGIWAIALTYASSAEPPERRQAPAIKAERPEPGTRG